MELPLGRDFGQRGFEKEKNQGNMGREWRVENAIDPSHCSQLALLKSSWGGSAHRKRREVLQAISGCDKTFDLLHGGLSGPFARMIFRPPSSLEVLVDFK